MNAVKAIAAILAGATAATGAAGAQTIGGFEGGRYDDRFYGSLSAGVSLMPDAETRGPLANPFTTGEGTTVPAGTTLPSGTSLGWETDFNPGMAASGALGRGFGPIRAEIEVAYQRNGVDSHGSAFIGGVPLDGEDAGVLTTGSPRLGRTVADTLGDGRGKMETVFLMANAYYDFDFGARFRPYIGAGVGVGFIDVDFRPSGLRLVDDGATNFAWQAMGGLSYELTPQADLFAGYRYRSATNPEVSAVFLPARIEVEHRTSIIEAGVRYAF